MSEAVQNRSIHQSGTFSALRSSAFRLYFAGQLVSVSGTWMQAIAQQIVVYNLTHSELALGLVACAQGLPALLFTLVAGVLVENFPRRQLLIISQILLMVLAFIFALLEFTGNMQVWHIVVLSLGVGVANALDAPARQSFLVEMVGREQLRSGIVLQSIMFNAARVVGPALAALLLKLIGPNHGPGWLFLLNGMSFLAVIASLLLMRVPAIRHSSRNLAIIEPLKQGLQYSWSHSTIRPLLLLSAATSIFGLTFAVLIPSFADIVLHDIELGTATLNTGQGIGAILAGVAVARAANRGRGGKSLFMFSLAGPIFVLLFAVSRTMVLATIFATFAGYFIIGQFIFMNTLIQSHVEDEYRGRVLSIYSITFFGFNPFASLAIGLIAQVIGTIPAILIYGSASLVASSLILWRNPQVRQLA